MTVLSDSWLVNIFSFFVASLAIFIVWINWTHTYWKRRGLPSVPTTFFFGNAKDLLSQKESFAEFTQNLYNYFKNRNLPHGGCYFVFNHTYLPVDPNIIKNILQVDFDHFVDRGVYSNEEGEPLSAHLFSLEGAKWKNLRMKLTPTFTSGKMKMMFDTLVKCGDELIIEMDKNAGASSVDIKDILARFTTDIIGNCAFGIDCNSLKDPDNEFNTKLKLFFVDGFWDNIIGFISFIAPKLTKQLGVKILKPTLSNFFMRVVTETVEYREKNNIDRKDFMHLLLQLKNKGRLDHDGVNNEHNEKNKDTKLTLNEVAAQAFIFFLAGFETSSTTMTFVLFELASNPDIQSRLREEIDKVLKQHDNKLTYDAIMDMHYMDKVINETLRKYPPLPVLTRMCNKDYQIPGTTVVLEKGTTVLIPVIGIHHDPEYYPNPERFDPERFSEEAKNQRPHCTHLPFGEGPRNCIGLRFGIMQTKVGLSILLQNYKFFLSPKTMLPIKFDPKCFIMTTEGGMWLDYTKI